MCHFVFDPMKYTDVFDLYNDKMWESSKDMSYFLQDSLKYIN